MLKRYNKISDNFTWGLVDHYIREARNIFVYNFTASVCSNPPASPTQPPEVPFDGDIKLLHDGLSYEPTCVGQNTGFLENSLYSAEPPSCPAIKVSTDLDRIFRFMPRKNLARLYTEFDMFGVTETIYFLATFAQPIDVTNTKDIDVSHCWAEKFHRYK